MRCCIKMASSVVSERRSPAATAMLGTAASSESSTSSLREPGVVSDTCFVKPAVNNNRLTIDQ